VLTSRNGRPTPTASAVSTFPTTVKVPPLPAVAVTLSGRTTNGTRMTPRCTRIWMDGRSRTVARCEYRYPRSNVAWKNSTLVVQTAADPPRSGNNIRLAKGWTEKTSNADTNDAAMKIAVMRNAPGLADARLRISAREGP